MKKIERSKNKLWMFTTIILLLLIIFSSLYYFKFYPKQKRFSEVQNIKKEFYNSVVCEYGCPLKSIKYQNQTQMLPDVECVKNCTQSFKALGKINLTKEEALNDNLLRDIESKIQQCKTSSTANNIVDNTLFFKCSSEELPKIREDYNYLN